MNIKMKIHTIGVYNSTEKEFFDKLVDNKIDLFCDIRQRRGVRGAQYKYVNSNYLQSKLSDLRINYKYIKDLAPTDEIRQAQKEADKLNGKTKKQRNTLGFVFRSKYNKLILEKFDFDALVMDFKQIEAQNIALFCVEAFPAACHRSLVAERLAKKLNCEVINL